MKKKFRLLTNLILIFIVMKIGTSNLKAQNSVKEENSNVPVITQPKEFAAGIIIGSAPAFTTDGKCVFTHAYIENKGHTIMVSYFTDGKWTPSKTAGFSGKYDDLEPFFSADEKRIYFCSSRPSYGENYGYLHIWYVEQTDTGWTEAQLMASPFNIQNSGSGVPSKSKNGSVYFASNRREGKWPWEIYYSHLDNGKYKTAVNINDTINSGYLSWSHCISPDESYLIFVSDRPDGLGAIDLYVSVRENGKWTSGINMGPEVNTSFDEVWPRLSHDGRYLFFNRQGSTSSIYQVDIQAILNRLLLKSDKFHYHKF
jgi:Tol biopolymer transport system component